MCLAHAWPKARRRKHGISHTTMKITVGIDQSVSAADAAQLVDDGADEFFAGFLPPAWSERYGWELNPNRRCMGPAWQYTDFDQLRDVTTAIHALGKSIFLTFNTHQYAQEQYVLLREIMSRADELAPDAYIIADPALLLLLPRWGLERPVHLSTGAACFNSETVRYYCSKADVRRAVIPRKLSLPEMAALIHRLDDTAVEFEVMIIGGRCYFNDEFCMTRHCRNDRNFCSYFQGRPTSTQKRFPPDWKRVLDKVKDDLQAQCVEDSPLNQFLKAVAPGPIPERPRDAASYEQQDGGSLAGWLAEMLVHDCGLCAIPRLRDIGVTSLKVIARGEVWNKRFLVRLVRKVVDNPEADAAYCRQQLNSPSFCAILGNCYYDVRDGRE